MQRVASGLTCPVVRTALVIVMSCLGLACTGPDSTPRRDPSDIPPPSAPAHGVPPPQEPASQCPAGTERHDRGGEGPDWDDWWCARGDVPHGPFIYSNFDERARTWYLLSGEHLDGQRHGMSQAEGFYLVGHTGRSRVFRRELHDHGRIVRSNEASLRVDFDATTPVVARRFVVKASGLVRTLRWEAETDAIGTFDVEVSTTWTDAPADAPPSVLRVELSAPSAEGPTRVDALLHPSADADPPTITSSLPLGYSPTASAPWIACDPAGCELELDVTLRWLAPGPGRLEAYVTARAVPDAWPEAAPIDVKVIP
jgi:hypothetical protein